MCGKYPISESENKSFAQLHASFPPNHGLKQVTSINELSVDKRYIIHYKKIGSSYEVRLLRGPYKDDMDQWSIEVWYEYLASGETVLLCDAGVVPYGDGTWNKVIWLERV